MEVNLILQLQENNYFQTVETLHPKTTTASVGWETETSPSTEAQSRFIFNNTSLGGVGGGGFFAVTVLYSFSEEG